jgi:protein TonB
MKNKNFLSIVLIILLMGFTAYAQDSLHTVAAPEKPAEFKGGLNGWAGFLQKNLDRDLLQRNNAPAGSYKAIADFLVDSTGQVSDIKIEVNPGYGVSDEFIRMLKLSSKKWIPAIDKGKNVSSRHKQSLTLIN